jgi:hypothetical protein
MRPFNRCGGRNQEAVEVFGETPDGEPVQFWPIRPTAARSLRPGDEILVPDPDDPTQQAMHGRITDIRDDPPPTGMIIVNGELVRGEAGLFEKPAHPWELIDRVVQPDEPLPGSEFRLVRGDEIWKWLQTEINDPHGSAEKYLLRTFRRVQDDEFNCEVIEVKGQSTWDPKKVITMTLFPEAVIRFDGHR